MSASAAAACSSPRSQSSAISEIREWIRAWIDRDLGVLERVREQRQAVLPVALRPDDAAEVEQHVRRVSSPGRQSTADSGSSSRRAPDGVAGEVEAARRAPDAPARDGGLVRRRRHPQSELLQLGCRLRGSARRNRLGRPIERLGGLLVRPGRRERQVPRALLGVDEALGEQRGARAACGPRRRLVDADASSGWSKRTTPSPPTVTIPCSSAGPSAFTSTNSVVGRARLAATRSASAVARGSRPSLASPASAPPSARVAASPARGTPVRSSSRAISSAWNGLPALAAAMLTSTGRGNARPSDDFSIACSAATPSPSSSSSARRVGGNGELERVGPIVLRCAR